MKRTLQVSILFLLLVSVISSQDAHAYSLTNARPVFLAWPMPSYISVARISQFPNSPWTWNYLGLNPDQQCTPAFGYLESSLSTWRDTSLSWEDDAAQADPHQFQMIACYATEGVAGTNGHEGTDIKALVGTPVLASADGKVADWRLSGLTAMIVLKHCLDGAWDANNDCTGTKWYTTYMHIIVDTTLQQKNMDVKEGAVLGTIYDQGENSHLHFEVGLDKRDYANYVNPWGRDRSPWLGCMWKDQALCVLPNPARKKFLFQRTDQAIVKSFYGSFESLPKLEKSSSYQIVGDRIGALTEDGTFWLLNQETGWQNVEEKVSAFQITKDRMAILTRDGILRVQEGVWTGQWGVETQGVKSFSISDHRVGALGLNGELFIVEGALSTPWTFSASDVTAFQLIDARIGYVDSQGSLMVQEGKLDSEWKLMAEKVKAFQLSGVQVAYLNQADELWVNHGNLRAEFLLQAKEVQYFQQTADRILVQDKNGEWQIKQGRLYDAWTLIQVPFAEHIWLDGQISVFME